MHLRDRVFNSVKRRPKVFLSGRGSFVAMSPTRSTFPSLLSPTSTTFLFYIARSILQPLESLSPHLALFQNAPSRISFRELSFVLSRHFFLILLFTAVHPTFNSHSTTMLYSLTLVSAISSCVLKQLFFPVSLPTWIITSPARKAPLLPFFHSILFCSLTL